MNRQDDFDDGWVGIFKNIEKLESSLYKSLRTQHECTGERDNGLKRVNRQP